MGLASALTNQAGELLVLTGIWLGRMYKALTNEWATNLAIRTVSQDAILAEATNQLMSLSRPTSITITPMPALAKVHPAG